jgi:hypothetical protein
MSKPRGLTINLSGSRLTSKYSPFKFINAFVYSNGDDIKGRLLPPVT